MSDPPPATRTEEDATPATAAPILPGKKWPGKWWWPALCAVALAFGAWGLWTTLMPAGVVPAGNNVSAASVEALRQQVATLSRSDQISRNANLDLQGTLAERDEEIAGLRADVAFYERFVGATGQRRGLTVHELQLQVQPQNDQAWQFTATLTQNLNRGAVSSGQVTLSVEGTRDGKLQKLAWSDLRQQANAPGVPYSFKYFEEVAGDLILPPGFKPLRVTARLVPKDGAAVEQSFAWADVMRAPVPRGDAARTDAPHSDATPRSAPGA